MKELRELIAIKTGRYDTNYTLVRTADGTICVETFASPNKPFQNGSSGPTIYPAEFDQHVIDDGTLLDRVEEAIRRADGPSK